MSAPKSNAPETVFAVTDREIVITRVLKAPRELVFSAFTDPKHIGQWWGPTGFTTTIHAMDVQPGGAWRYTMHGPDGVDYPNKTVYIEIVAPRRLVYEHGSDVPNLKDDPHHFHVTITFQEQDQQTLVTMRSRFASAEQCAGAKQFGAIEGGNQTLSRLDDYLARDVSAAKPITLRVTRRFTASAEQVFDAWLDPAHVGQWLFATPTGKMIRVAIDARVGGRFVIIERRGEVDAYHTGEYSEIDRPRRLAFSFAANQQMTDAATVQIDIVSLPQGCELTLTQTLPAKFADYADRTQQGWTAIMVGLERLLSQEGL
jgi:uncharacterized protein YndB with AHSA1/START domain